MPSLTILAALERAGRHQDDSDGVPWGSLIDHLGLIRSGATTLKVRASVLLLVEEGLVVEVSRHSGRAWGLTEAGRRRVRQARRRKGWPGLPEAPQHRRWRQARATADLQIAQLRADVLASLADARALFDELPGESERWVELGHAIGDGCVRLAAATYCLHEWTEPEDAKCDAPSMRRAETLAGGFRPRDDAPPRC